MVNVHSLRQSFLKVWREETVNCPFNIPSMAFYCIVTRVSVSTKRVAAVLKDRYAGRTCGNKRLRVNVSHWLNFISKWTLSLPKETRSDTASLRRMSAFIRGCGSVCVCVINKTHTLFLGWRISLTHCSPSLVFPHFSYWKHKHVWSCSCNRTWVQTGGVMTEVTW